MQEKSAWKVFEFGTFSAQCFSDLDQTRRFTLQISAFSPNATKIWNMDQKNSILALFREKRTFLRSRYIDI